MSVCKACGALVAPSWQPIETAPKDETVIDIFAKRWSATDDKFEFQRFPGYMWGKHIPWQCKDGRSGNGREQWVSECWSDFPTNEADWFPKEWRATHWMMPPPGPNSSSGGK